MSEVNLWRLLWAITFIMFMSYVAWTMPDADITPSEPEVNFIERNNDWWQM